MHKYTNIKCHRKNDGVPIIQQFKRMEIFMRMFPSNYQRPRSNTALSVYFAKVKKKKKKKKIR